MSNKMVRGTVAATVTALAIAGSAYGATGKSPNGEPGPSGNPNPPTAQPQANGPAGPVGNEQQPAENKGQTAKAEHSGSSQSHGKANSSHGKSDSAHGKSGASHGKNGSAPSHSNGSHANPTPGTPRGKDKSGAPHENNGAPKGKITICHATKSETNPYVEITISVNGLHGHGPADDPHHHAGSWKDIIPAPAGGCPSTVQPQQQTSAPTGSTTEQTPTTTTVQSGNVAKFVVAPEVQTPAAPASTDAQAVLGARASGGDAPATANATAPATGTAPASEVLGAQASGSNVPAAAQATRAADASKGTLPFTGFQLAFVLLVAAVALLGGFALRRATAADRG